jgi:hypothetical protein
MVRDVLESVSDMSARAGFTTLSLTIALLLAGLSACDRIQQSVSADTGDPANGNLAPVNGTTAPNYAQSPANSQAPQTNQPT